MSVRTQTGLRSDPPSDVEDPGYDFWMIFSRRKVFIRRSHASAYVNCPSRLDADEFLESGWHLHRRAATPLLSGARYADATCRHPALDEEQVRRIEERLFSGWEPPIPAHALRRLFETDHYSAVTMRPARTELFALEDVP